jgi:hypothetical protein
MIHIVVYVTFLPGVVSTGRIQVAIGGDKRRFPGHTFAGAALKTTRIHQQ